MNKVNLADVAIESRESLKTKDSSLPVVGLEHIIPEQINLTEWDVGVDNTFTKIFKKNDVLFGRRRAYLKKAAVAPCEGICSGDITVIRAKEDKILPELLPFVIQNDIFFDYAVGKSAGSLSPRVKWEHLANYEFNLPSLPEQKKLADTLWSIVATMESYKKLLAKTDEMVKAKFVEIFGNPQTNEKKWELKKLFEIANYYIGLTYKPEDIADNGILVLRSGNIQNYEISLQDNVYVNCDIREKLFVKENDILMCTRNGSANLVGKVAIIPKLEKPTTFGAFMTIIRSPYYEYLYIFFQTNYFRNQMGGTKTSTVNQITQSMLDKVELPVPPMSEINKFSKILQKAKESKSAIQASLDSLTQVYKKIIAENLGGNINAN